MPCQMKGSIAGRYLRDLYISDCTNSKSAANYHNNDAFNAFDDAYYNAFDDLDAYDDLVNGESWKH